VNVVTSLVLGMKLRGTAGRRERWVVSAVVLICTVVIGIGCAVMSAMGQAQARNDRMVPGVTFDETGAAWGISWSAYGGRSVRSLLVGADLSTAHGDPVTLGDGESLVSSSLQRSITEDPSLAGRVPGRIVGVLPDSALVVPTGLEAITVDASASLPYLGRGWGRPGTDRPDSISDGATLVTVELLALLPAVGGLVGAGLTVARGIRPQVSRLALVGAPASVIRGVVAGSVARAAGPPAVLGALGAAVAVAWGGRTGAWGIAFFHSVTAATIVPLVAIAGLVVMALLVGALSATRPDPRPSVQSTRRPDRPRPRMLAVGLLGLVLLVGVQVSRTITSANSGWITFWQLALVVGAAMLLLGAPALAARVLVWLSSRVPAHADPRLLLPARRLAHRPTNVMVRVAATSVLLTVVALAGAVAAILAQGAPASAGAAWASSSYHVDATHVRELGRVAGQGGVIAVQNDGRRQVTGTCAALSAAYGTIATADGMPCEDGRTYRGDELGVADGSGPTAPIVIDEPVDAVVTDDPAAVVVAGGTWNVYLRSEVVDLDGWESDVLRIAPISDFTFPGGDSRLVVVLPALRHLVAALVVLGLASGVGSLLLFGDGESHSLRALGASLRSRRAIAVSGAALGSAVASAIGAGVALIVAATYLSLNPEPVTDAGTGWIVVSVAIGVTVVSGAGAAIGLVDRAGRTA